MSAQRTEHASWAGRLGRLAVLAGLYLLTGRLGLALAHYQDNATLFWPPTGLALAALILYGRALWTGVFIGAFAVCVSTSMGPLPALGIATGNTLEAVVGAWLLERVGRFRPELERVRDVIAFMLLGALGCTLVSATIGTVTLHLAGSLQQAEPGLVWLIWWLGDAGGAIVVAPLLLLIHHGRPDWKALLRQRESWLVLLAVLGTSLLAFGGFLSGPWALLVAFFPFPFVVWAGSRLGPRGAVAVSLCIAVVAVVGTARGQGPFVVPQTHASLMLLWAYGITMGTAALTLAAAIAQRQHSEALRRTEGDSRLELERRMHQAQRLEGLGLLAGGIAHDFNNILAAIRGNTELLGMRELPDPAARERLRQIEVATDRAADLCRRLLAYAGRRKPELKSLAVAGLIEETCTLLEPSLKKRVQVVTSIAADTPAIEGDPTLLRQVLMNLVLNAAESIGEGEGTVTVSAGGIKLGAGELRRMLGATEARPGRFVYLEVVDTGAGMDAATLERIFDPFFSTKFEGRGLGLATALGIVKSHGGALDVESAPGQGTRFRVHVPASRSTIQHESTSRWVRRTRGRERLVLVADDEPAVLEVVVRSLESAGYRTVCARDGREALELYRRRAGELSAALLDVTMPGKSGVEVLAEIRAGDVPMPVVLMSGYEPQDTARTVEPDAFLRKPFAQRDLLDQLGRVLADPD